MTGEIVTRPLRDFVAETPMLEDLVGPNDALFSRNDAGYAGFGALARGPLDEMHAFLDGLAVDSSVTAAGSRGLALGWHSFDGTRGEAVVPRITIGVGADGDGWASFPRGAEDEVTAVLSGRPSADSPTNAYTIRPGVDPDRYLDAVGTARDAVRRGELTKVVIARDIIVEASQPMAVAPLLRRLRGSFGSSYRFAIDNLVGASPELLVERRGDVVRSHPLAGTTPRTGDPANDARLAEALRSSDKNRIEHRVVVDMVHDTLLPWCSYLDWEPEPDVVAVANVQHLGTRVEGRLSEPLAHVLDLMRALCPTPALGGHPRDAALRLIADVEGMRRDRYGGAVGWFDAGGDGTFAVTIRCAEFSSDWRRARLLAGGGIVADSVPLSELGETQAKFQAMLAAIVRP